MFLKYLIRFVEITRPMLQRGFGIINFILFLFWGSLAAADILKHRSITIFSAVLTTIALFFLIMQLRRNRKNTDGQ